MTEEKKQKIYDLYSKRFEKSKPTIWFAKQVIGNIIATFVARSLEPLFYWALETEKIVGLKRHRQNYDTETELSNEACSEFVWWKHNPSEDQWAEHERMHINVLGLKAAFVGIRTYCHNRSYKHIWVMSDSSTAIACFNNKGGIKIKKCNEIAKEIWLQCFKNNSFISLARVPGKHNIETDKFSRKFNNNTEW